MSRPRSERLVAGVRLGWGAVLMLWPDPVVRAGSGRTATTAARRVVRVLGVRHLVQAGVTLARPSATVRTLGVATDVLHALTGVGFGLLPTTWRRGALLDAGLAASFATAGAVSGRCDADGTARTRRS